MGKYPRVAIDRDLRNADWAKRAWDLPFADADELRTFLAFIGMTVEHFMTLPVYQLNRDKLPWLRDLAQSGGGVTP